MKGSLARQAVMRKRTKRPICDTPGCGRTIPVGGEGHPEICPKCLTDLDVKTIEQAVNHPPHYQAGGLEAIDVIEAFGLGFNLGNAVKYILRAGRKANRQEDLKKARWYLDRELTADARIAARLRVSGNG